MALWIIAVIFAMTAMVGNRALQFKVPRPDAYEKAAMADSQQIDRAVVIAATLAGLLGGTVLLGWTLDVSLLTRFSPHWKPMVPLTALCFVLGGSALLTGAPFAAGRLRMAQTIATSLVLLLAGARCFEVALGLHIGTGPGLSGWLMPAGTQGQMSPQTAVGFMLLGAGVAINRRRTGRSAVILLRCLAGALLAMGLAVALGYWLKFPYIFQTLYFRTGLVWMSFPTACGMALLGAGLWGLSLRNNPAGGRPAREITEGRIYQTSVLVLVTVLIAAGLTALAFLEDAIERMAKSDMLRSLDSARFFITVDLDNRIQRALLAGNESVFVAAAATLAADPTDNASVADMRRFAESLLPLGFSGVDVQGQGPRRMNAGRLLAEGAFSVRLNGVDDVWLVWDKAYYLRVRVPVRGAEGGVSTGHLLVEQPLPGLDDFFARANRWGDSGNMPLCARLNQTELVCFPQRESLTPFRVADHFQGAPLPATRALAGESEFAMTTDYRGHPVLAVYGPVGATGLGLVVRMDMAEVYAPVKDQLLFALPFFALLAGVGVWLIRMRVKPLADELAGAYADAQFERARFVAAMDSSPDIFLILESVTNEAGEIVDFRFAYLNQVARATPELSGQVVGRTMLELFPAHTQGFTESKNVAVTGQMRVADFSVPDGKGGMLWYQRQAVAMSGGVASTIRNITHEKMLFRQVEESNMLRTAILESAAYAIISTDANGTILTFNKAAERMLWYSAHELVGKSTPTVFHDADAVAEQARILSEELGFAVEPGFDVFVAKARTSLKDEREWTYVRKDGSRFPVLLSVTALRDANNTLRGYLGIAHDISAQKRADEYIRHIALHDVLTGLPNRALLEDRIAVAIERQRRNAVPFVLVMMDIDRFKHVNDSMGHHIGDRLLREFVERIKTCLRPTDTLARMGGDEFVILLTESDVAGATVVVDRVLKALTPPIDVGLQELHITSSMGISSCPADGNDMNELLRCADVAMYWVKAHGRNGYKVFSHAMDHGVSERLHLERDLHRAIETGEFALFYQPQADLESKAIFGVEALLRWRRPDGRYVSPATFIPLAEDTGLIVPIGSWVLQTACRAAIRMREELGRPVKIAVNISPRQFADGALVGLVQDTLRQTGLDAAQLELEITEGVLMDERSGVAASLVELSALGVSIAIDDFGTGYSSLSYLKRFPISKIKIDQSFVRDVTSDPEDAALAVAIIAMGRSLRIPVTAEGIETAQQLAFLTANNCHGGQGFYIGRPMPLDALLQWFATDAHAWWSDAESTT